MESFREIITVIGTAELGKLFGIGTGHVNTMRQRNSIPPEYWALLIERAAQHGITLDYPQLRAWRREALGRATLRRQRTG